MGQKLLLSDDEVAAAAMRLGGEWKASLPTIDVDDAADLLRAVARGHRSLFLRGLLSGTGGDELAEQVAGLLAPAVGKLPEQLGYAANSEDLYAAVGARFAVFAAGPESKLLVLTLPNGINEISVLRAEGAREFVESFASAARKAGDRGKAVVVIAPTETDLAVFAVAAADRVTTGTGSPGSLDLETGRPSDGLPLSVLPR